LVRLIPQHSKGPKENMRPYKQTWFPGQKFLTGITKIIESQKMLRGLLFRKGVTESYALRRRTDKGLKNA